MRELSDALASRRCAEVRPHPKFTVDGNAETRVLLANEQRALEVCSLSYLAEGLPLPDAVRLVGLGVGAGNCCWLPYLATQRPELLPRSPAQFNRYVRACIGTSTDSPLWPCTGLAATAALGIHPTPSRFSTYPRASQWEACLRVYAGGSTFDRIVEFVECCRQSQTVAAAGDIIRHFLRELPTGSRLSPLRSFALVL